MNQSYLATNRRLHIHCHTTKDDAHITLCGMSSAFTKMSPTAFTEEIQMCEYCKAHARLIDLQNTIAAEDDETVALPLFEQYKAENTEWLNQELAWLNLDGNQ